MSIHRTFRGVVPLLCACLLMSGCTALRELPRSEFGARPERQRVRIQTTEGLAYEFDYIQVSGDTLTGFREHEVEGPVSEVSTLRLPLDQVRVLSVHEVDWFRSGVVGGTVLAGIVAAGLSRQHSGDASGSSSGGGKGGIE